LFGRTMSAPIIISPTGMAGLARARADLLLARAANDFGVPFTLSTVGTVSIEDLAAGTNGPLWFQLHILRNRNLSRELMRRAAAAKYDALVVTIDQPVSGHRERDARNSLTVPLRPTLANALDLVKRGAWLADLARHGPPRPENMVGANDGASNGQALSAYMISQLDPSVTWEDVAWVRKNWDGPMVVKGLITPEDARKAIDLGAEGVVISNHGGRQLDGAPPPLEVLPSVVDAIGGRGLIFCDSGFRRGADIVKAIALGANAVLVGRATLWGVAAGGQPGVTKALTILRNEIDRAMGLMGVTSIGDLNRSTLWDRSNSQRLT
jgi:isopentenyl diphosphate isomerase/L-lactate dehydrogenase-like FMN-dependent dehydrogenase